MADASPCVTLSGFGTGAGPWNMPLKSCDENVRGVRPVRKRAIPHGSQSVSGPADTAAEIAKASSEGDVVSQVVPRR